MTEGGVAVAPPHAVAVGEEKSGRSRGGELRTAARRRGYECRAGV